MTRKLKRTLILAIVVLVIFSAGLTLNLLLPRGPYKVTFNTNGGEPLTYSIEVQKGTELELPEVFREGYSLDGWYNGKRVWTDGTKVTKDTELTARWVKNIYLITFVVGNKEFYQYENYGDELTFKGDTSKEPTISTSYTFIGWDKELSKVTENATYVAKYSQRVREYTVEVDQNIPSAGVIAGEGQYEYNTDAIISTTLNFGFTFDGWFDGNGDLISTSQTLSLREIKSDYKITAKYTPIEKTITYIDELSANNDNPIKYDVRDGVVALHDLQKDGYNFLGFFTEANGGGEKVTEIECSDLTDYTLYADWGIITYTITYNLDGKENNPLNASSFTIESNDITIYPLEDTEDGFIGWTGTGLTTATKQFVIKKGSIGDRVYTPVWSGGARVISLFADGMELTHDSIIKNEGERIQSPVIDSSLYDMTGYTINGWYTDEGLTNRYTFSTMPDYDLTLYGTFEYAINTGFKASLSKFQNASKSTSNPVLINSYEELITWVEYVEFYNITESYIIKLTYKSVSGEALYSELLNAIKDSRYPGNSTLSYGTVGSLTSVGTINVNPTRSNRTYEYELKVADSLKLSTYPQLDYGYKLTATGSREDDFNNFAVENVKNTLEVETSNQLVYALEMGYRPIVKPGSPAELVYNKAREILIDIIDDNMSDYEKTLAIYEYLVLNVAYDNYAFTNIEDDWEEYDSWYLEGALLNNVAVCDGIAKSFLVLARIENIPAIRVDGDKHAWNKVMLFNKWYGIDATHGNIVNESGYEYLSFGSFLFTDEYQEDSGYSTTDYIQYTADSEFSYYDYQEYSYNGQHFDLVADSEAELILILSFMKTNLTESINYSFEFVINYTGFSSNKILTTLGVSYCYYNEFTSSSGERVYSVKIK